ncbi:MAG: FAD-binding protein [Planctomycetota bacterium]|nr:FAD-binding protein [Planctomycetota bacterium]
MNSTSEGQVALPVLDPTTEREREAIAQDLERILGSAVRFGRHDRMLYSTDASLYQVAPIGVVCPTSCAQAVEVIRYCAARSLPVLPRGAGASLAGQTVNVAIVLDFSQHCRRILSIDQERRIATVEPGVVLDQLNDAVSPMGLFFGPDVATSTHATLGGMIGNNSAGARSIVYGRTVENLSAVTAALADGTVERFARGSAILGSRQWSLLVEVERIVRGARDSIQTRIPTILRHVDGYNLDLVLKQLDGSCTTNLEQVNLSHLLCGSEGTLATTLQAEVNLVELPRCVALVIAPFASVVDALAPIAAMLSTHPSAVELVDDVILALAQRNAECRGFLDVIPKLPTGHVGAVIYVEYSGSSEDEVRGKIDQLRGLLKGVPLVVHTEKAAMVRAWKLRKAGEPLLHGVPGVKKPVTFVEDTAVDPIRLPAFVDEFRSIVARHGTTAAYYAHASVGCLHIRPMIAMEHEADHKVLVSIAVEVADLVTRYGGALSGEHGDGRLRTPLLDRVLGPELCQANREIKQVFDPENRMNPGNLVDVGNPHRIVERLRVKPYNTMIHPPEVATFFRFEREEGFSRAATLCNGAGMCRRQTTGGVMCPSYRATLDERHATRGRGNALRLAVTGQLGASGQANWNDPETEETLDLCLSCKACAAECPSNVDIAKLKSEYTAQGFLAAGHVPWRTRIIGHVRLVNRMGSALWPISDWMRQCGPIRRMVNGWLGFSPERSLPPFEPRLRASSMNHTESDDRPVVVLMADCFCAFSESSVGKSAVALLERFGYRVVVTDAGCCGRSLISTGMLADAIRTCSATALRLDGALTATKARAILVLEPSCASAIRDDWQDLRLDPAREAAARVGRASMLVEEFLEAHWDAHPTRPLFTKEIPEIVLHAHCHQKSLWGSGSSANLLRRICGDRMRVLETGCCGMAGAFGMAAHRFELSRAIANLELLPALSQSPDALVCAPGASCRHQIFDLAHRKAIHPVQIVLALIDDAAWKVASAP